MLDLDRVKRIWFLSSMRAAKVQASLRIRAVSPEPSLLAHTSSESRRTFRQKPRSLAPLNGWACAVETCRDGMLEDTNSLDGAHFIKAVAVYEVEVGTNSCLSEYMNTYESLFDLCPGALRYILSNIFCSEAKFHVELLWIGRTEVCSNSPGHVTKMATMSILSIYGRNSLKH